MTVVPFPRRKGTSLPFPTLVASAGVSTDQLKRAFREAIKADDDDAVAALCAACQSVVARSKELETALERVRAETLTVLFKSNPRLARLGAIRALPFRRPYCISLATPLRKLAQVRPQKSNSDDIWNKVGNRGLPHAPGSL